MFSTDRGHLIYSQTSFMGVPCLSLHFCFPSNTPIPLVSDALARTGLPHPSSFRVCSVVIFSFAACLIIWVLTPFCCVAEVFDASNRKSLLLAKKLSLQQVLHCLVCRLNKTGTQHASNILLPLSRARWHDDWDSWLNFAALTIVSSQKQVLTDSG